MPREKFYNRNSYVFWVTGFTLIAFFIIWIFSLKTDWVKKDAMNILALGLRIVFILGILLIGVVEFLKTNTNFNSLFFIRNLLIFSLIISLIFSIFDYILSSYAIGIYVFFVLIYFFYKKEIYPLNKIYLLLFIYAFLQIVGTIGTTKGFHFPEKVYSFYILPFSYCFFHFEKKTMLRILKLTFRLIFFYSCVSLIYWWFNVNSFDISTVKWLTEKNPIDDLPAYYYVGNWANFSIGGVFINYSHPTYVSLVLISALIGGFYLHYKKDKTAYISTLELLVFSLAIFLLILAYESRIGAIGFIIITICSLLYYVKLKNLNFKLIIFILFIIGTILVTVFGSRLMNTVQDTPREISYAFAMHHIKDHIWWGCGTEEQKIALDNADIAMPEVSRLPGFSQYLYAHNQFLGETVQFGIWGFLMLSILVAGFIYYAFKSRNYLLQLYWLIYFIGMMIEEPLYIQQGILRFCVFLTFFVAIGDADKELRPFKVNVKSIFAKN